MAQFCATLYKFKNTMFNVMINTTICYASTTNKV